MWQLFNRLIDTLAVLAAVMMCVLVLLICADVLARATAWFQLPWSVEVSGLMLGLMTFLAAPWVLRENGHIAIDLVTNALPPRAKEAAARVAMGLGAAICLTLVYLSTRLLMDAYADQLLVFGTLVYPEWWVYVVPPPIFLLLTIIFARRMMSEDAIADLPAQKDL